MDESSRMIEDAEGLYDFIDVCAALEPALNALLANHGLNVQLLTFGDTGIGSIKVKLADEAVEEAE